MTAKNKGSLNRLVDYHDGDETQTEAERTVFKTRAGEQAKFSVFSWSGLSASCLLSALVQKISETTSVGAVRDSVTIIQGTISSSGLHFIASSVNKP